MDDTVFKAAQERVKECRLKTRIAHLRANYIREGRRMLCVLRWMQQERPEVFRFHCEGRWYSSQKDGETFYILRGYDRNLVDQFKLAEVL